jgi:hypothetical protein
MRICSPEAEAAKKRESSLRSRLFFPLLVLTAYLVSAAPAYAGFGITPPYVDNDRLTRGTIYKQTINLVRSDPDTDLQTTITVNVPGAQDWISVDKGMSFVLPKGENQFPIEITVRVPANAEFNSYKGTIRIRTAPSGDVPEGGGVSIALGAQVDVSMKVVDKIYDFNVRRIRLADLETGRTKWGLYFPGKIRFFMTIENTGNTEFGPTKVHFDLYDNQMESLLESTDNLNRIERIPPFGTKEVVAELPTHLPPGLYVAKYTIYKNEEIAQQGQLHLSIGPPGTVAGYEGYGFDGLSVTDKLKVIAVFAVPLLIVGFFLYLLLQRRKRRRR